MFNNKLHISARIFCLIIIIFCPGSFAEPVNTDNFIEILRGKIQIRYNVPPQDVIIIYKDIDLEEKLKKFGTGNIELKIKDYTLSIIAGKESLPVEVYVDGKYKSTVILKITMDVFKDVFLTNRDVRRGEVLSEENIKKERKFISTLPNNVLYNADNIYGTSVLRDLSVNTVIASSMIKAIPVILKGNIVTLRLKNKNLTIVSQGEALEDGYMGGIIKVKVTTFSSNKIIYAKVVGTNELEIDLKE